MKKLTKFCCSTAHHIVVLLTKGDFNTRVDIQLSQWAEQLLPQVSVEAGWETLQQEFRKLIEQNKSQKDHDDLFDDLKQAVLDEVLRRHKWEEKVNARLDPV